MKGEIKGVREMGDEEKEGQGGCGKGRGGTETRQVN